MPQRGSLRLLRLPRDPQKGAGAADAVVLRNYFSHERNNIVMTRTAHSAAIFLFSTALVGCSAGPQSQPDGLTTGSQNQSPPAALARHAGKLPYAWRVEYHDVKPHESEV